MYSKLLHFALSKIFSSSPWPQCNFCCFSRLILCVWRFCASQNYISLNNSRCNNRTCIFSQCSAKVNMKKSLESAISTFRYHIIVPVQFTLWIIWRWRRSLSGNWKMAPQSLQMRQSRLICAVFICIWKNKVNAIMLVFCVTIMKGFRCKTYMLIEISGSRVAEGAKLAWERISILRIIQDESSFIFSREKSPLISIPINEQGD